MSSINTKPTPGPSGLEAIRHWIRMARDPLAGFVGLYNEYGDAVRIPLTPGRAFFLLSRPEHAEHIFVRHQERYAKAFTYRPMKDVLGDGLLTSEGETWQRHRRVVQPIFSHRHIQGFGPLIAEVTRERVSSWRIGSVVDLGAEMRGLTMSLIGHILFGIDLADRADTVGRAVSKLQSALIPAAALSAVSPQRTRTLARFLVPGLESAATALDSLVDEIIEARLASPHAEPSDLLDILMFGSDGERFSRQEIHNEMMILVLAGHETTTNTLTWALTLLSRFPAARARIVAEVEHALGDRNATAADVDSLPWTRAVVSESLRLYPSAWDLERDALVDDKVGDIEVSAGDTIAIAPYLLHRHPEFWPNPEGFDPGRFLPGNGGGRPRCAYFPFGGGRRICVGAGLAQLEATIGLATIAQSCTLDLQPGITLDARADITLRPRHPMRATVLAPNRSHVDDLVPS
ncbi:MAG: cytochrome P450 [Mycobacterium sp.]